MRALAILDDASDALGVPPDESDAEYHRLDAAIWISKALNEAEINGLDSAAAAFDAARSRAEAVGDAALLLRLHSQWATAAIRAGKFDLAAAEYSRAEPWSSSRTRTIISRFCSTVAICGCSKANSGRPGDCSAAPLTSLAPPR